MKKDNSPQLRPTPQNFRLKRASGTKSFLAHDGSFVIYRSKGGQGRDFIGLKAHRASIWLLVDGKRTARNICAELRERHSEKAILNAIGSLISQGVLTQIKKSLD